MPDKVKAVLADVSEKIEIINRDLEKILPRVSIKEVTSFGNSSHVILSRQFLDKKVGIILLEDFDLNERRAK